MSFVSSFPRVEKHSPEALPLRHPMEVFLEMFKVTIIRNVNNEGKEEDRSKLSPLRNSTNYWGRIRLSIYHKSLRSVGQEGSSPF
ncbi:hypothetical protein DPMN_035458 [Dreissena polymorpha]|uniref:Uncharacterized protein n=1 Tax=Dreissena polymorpha TaxID=45954 RepID=A0A9D4M8T9_DREPO|nr:hypothetical protein DPMN_035458 [Dreissena polymorpha]